MAAYDVDRPPALRHHAQHRLAMVSARDELLRHAASRI